METPGAKVAKRGRLLVYLGAAPGVGKTFAMLDEARRRQSRGTDVVVGLVETHGRPLTARQLEGLELIPRREITHRGSIFTEMDTDAILARRPSVVLVDELAHTNVPGSRHEKRSQDIEEIRAAGIDVITTVNIQHLESLNGEVERITGIRQRETVPDDVVRDADQIQLVDMSPEALRRRLAHGNVYRSEQIDASLSSYFRVGNLTALRELALLWLADRVDDSLESYRRLHRIEQSWPARERIVVSVTGGAESETLIRRGARIAQRSAGSELIAVHVLRSDGLDRVDDTALRESRRLVESLSGSFHTVVGDDVAEAIMEFARGVNASMVVVGVSSHTGIRQLFTGSTATQIAQVSGPIDVHLVTHDAAGGSGPLRRAVSPLSHRRQLAGWAAALLLPAALTLVLLGLHTGESLSLEVMSYLALTVLVAMIGGLLPSLLAAMTSFLLLNWFFTPPMGRFTVAEPQNLVALVVFVAVAAGVASVVDRASRRGIEAARARAEAATLAGLAQSVLTGNDTADAIVSRLRETFSLGAVSLLTRTAGGGWEVLASDGPQAPTGPDSADSTVPVDEARVIGLKGRKLRASDMRVVEGFAVQMGLVLEYRRLRERELRARDLERADATSTALLRAVSHDLRTPLATMRTSVDGLLVAGEARLGADDRAELLATLDQSTDHMERLIDNLLDLSRMAGGLLVPSIRATSLDEVLPLAVAEHPGRVRLELDESMPLVATDPGLLERVVANVVSNAVRHSPADQQVRIDALADPDTVEVRITDRGPGLGAEAQERMFEPFQRLGDTTPGGLGLGLAVAHGLALAVGGTLATEDTPGGGLTMVLTLPRAVAGS